MCKIKYKEASQLRQVFNDQTDQASFINHYLENIHL